MSSTPHPSRHPKSQILRALRRACLCSPLLLPLPASADFHIIYTFTDVFSTPIDAAEADGSLLLSGDTLFAVTEHGGDADVGTVFRYNLLTGDHSLLHTFSDAATAGQNPLCTLIQIGTTLYGTTSNGGAGNDDGGTLFKIDTSGLNFAEIHHFGTQVDPNNGWKSLKGVINSGPLLFGSTYGGGPTGQGTVYKFDTTTNQFSLLHTFTAVDQSPNFPDGGQPEGALLLAGNTLFGSTDIGGLGGRGSLFSIDTSGNHFALVHSFSGGPDDGDSPTGTPILFGHTLYGMTFNGGANPGNSGQGDGTIFRVDTDGKNFQLLHSFSSSADGKWPYGDLLRAGNTLYGLTSNGGPRVAGTLFQMNLDGSNFRVLHAFSDGDDGGHPIATLIRNGDSFYGLTESGGKFFAGVLFQFQLPPLTWTGQSDSAWSIASPNWTDGTNPTSLYADPYPVLFDDSAPLSSTTVQITTSLSPNSLLINTTTHAYIFSGPGSLLDVASLTKSGAAPLTLNIPIAANTLTLNAGTTTLTATAKVNTLSISHTTTGTSMTYSATLNLTTAKFILQSTDPADKLAKITELNAAITSGSNNGTWTGPGISSTTAAQDPAHYTLGLFDNALLGLTSFGDQPVDPNSLLITIAHLGDANDNAIVDIQDLTIIANNWQKSSTNWANGDLNRDNITDIQDFTIVANNWQQTSILSLSPFLPVSLSNTPVPEPTALPLFALSLLVLKNRRQRSS